MIQYYRPISVLPLFSKIFEKNSLYVIYYLKANTIFFPNHFGFRKLYGTNHALIRLVEKVSKALTQENL